MLTWIDYFSNFLLMKLQNGFFFGFFRMRNHGRAARRLLWELHIKLSARYFALGTALFDGYPRRPSKASPLLWSGTYTHSGKKCRFRRTKVFFALFEFFELQESGKNNSSSLRHVVLSFEAQIWNKYGLSPCATYMLK